MAAPKKTAATEDARAAILSSFVNEMNRKNPGAVMTYDTRIPVAAISTGAPSLDYALGIGGLPRGRIVELYGPEGSGKTSLAWSVCAEAIKDGGLVGYVDAEHAIDWDHAAWMGVDKRYVALSQPDQGGEEALRMAETMALSKHFPIVVIDSVAALVPKAELDGEIGDTHVGLAARMMSQACRKLAGVGASTGTTFLFINQLREKIGVMFGNPETTPGGRALKYYSSVRLDVRSPAGERIKGGKDGKDDIILGQRCKVKIVKNKLAAPFKSAEYNLIYNKGIDFNDSMFEAALKAGVIYKDTNGNSYFERLTGERIAVGSPKAKAALVENPELAGRISAAFYSVLQGDAVLPDDADIVAVADDAFDSDDVDDLPSAA